MPVRRPTAPACGPKRQVLEHIAPAPMAAVQIDRHILPHRLHTAPAASPLVRHVYQHPPPCSSNMIPSTRHRQYGGQSSATQAPLDGLTGTGASRRCSRVRSFPRGGKTIIVETPRFGPSATEVERLRPENPAKITGAHRPPQAKPAASSRSRRPLKSARSSVTTSALCSAGNGGG